MLQPDGTFRIGAGNDKIGDVFCTGMFNGHVGTGKWKVVRFEWESVGYRVGINDTMLAWRKIAICERVKN